MGWTHTGFPIKDEKRRLGKRLKTIRDRIKSIRILLFT